MLISHGYSTCMCISGVKTCFVRLTFLLPHALIFHGLQHTLHYFLNQLWLGTILRPDMGAAAEVAPVLKLQQSPLMVSFL